MLLAPGVGHARGKTPLPRAPVHPHSPGTPNHSLSLCRAPPITRHTQTVVASVLPHCCPCNPLHLRIPCWPPTPVMFQISPEPSHTKTPNTPSAPATPRISALLPTPVPLHTPTATAPPKSSATPTRGTLALREYRAWGSNTGCQSARGCRGRNVGVHPQSMVKSPASDLRTLPQPLQTPPQPPQRCIPKKNSYPPKIITPEAEWAFCQNLCPLQPCTSKRNTNKSRGTPSTPRQRYLAKALEGRSHCGLLLDIGNASRGMGQNLNVPCDQHKSKTE